MEDNTVEEPRVRDGKRTVLIEFNNWKLLEFLGPGDDSLKNTTKETSSEDNQEKREE